MQKIVETLETAKNSLDDYSAIKMRKALNEWAIFCLDKLDGDLLKKGLDMSCSMSAFLNELERGDE